MPLISNFPFSFNAASCAPFNTSSGVSSVSDQTTFFKFSSTAVPVISTVVSASVFQIVFSSSLSSILGFVVSITIFTDGLRLICFLPIIPPLYTDEMIVVFVKLSSVLPNPHCERLILVLPSNFKMADDE